METATGALRQVNSSVRHLASSVWPDVASADELTLLVPLGSTEQHGPHLPFGTDSQIAEAVAARGLVAVSAQPGAPSCLLAPTVPYGASGEHEGFPGTVSIGTEALALLLLEFGRSACRWASRLVFVNGHGGNAHALLSAVGRLRDEGRDVAWFPCMFDGADAHAGRTETSVLLDISPSQVRMDRARPGDTRPIGELLDDLRAHGVAGVSPNGVLGDPTGATAEAGKRDLSAVADRLSAAVLGWHVDQTGRLR